MINVILLALLLHLPKQPVKLFSSTLGVSRRTKLTYELNFTPMKNDEGSYKLMFRVAEKTGRPRVVEHDFGKMWRSHVSVLAADFIGRKSNRKQLYVSLDAPQTAASYIVDFDGKKIEFLYENDQARIRTWLHRTKRGKWMIMEGWLSFNFDHDKNFGLVYAMSPGFVWRPMVWNGNEFAPLNHGRTKVVSGKHVRSWQVLPKPVNTNP